MRYSWDRRTVPDGGGRETLLHSALTRDDQCRRGGVLEVKMLLKIHKETYDFYINNRTCVTFEDFA